MPTRREVGTLRPMKPWAPLSALVLAIAVGVFAGCGDKSVDPLPAQAVAPDFQLQDVNPNSLTAGQSVSPRAQLGKVSAWYFAHAT